MAELHRVIDEDFGPGFRPAKLFYVAALTSRLRRVIGSVIQNRTVVLFFIITGITGLVGNAS